MARRGPLLTLALTLGCTEAAPDDVAADSLAGTGDTATADSDGGTTDSDAPTRPQLPDRPTPGGGSGGGAAGGTTGGGSSPPPPAACSAPADTTFASVCDLSVNGASATVEIPSGPLVLRVAPGVTTPGEAFHGAGRKGLLALAGFHGFDGDVLADRASITVDAKKQGTTSLNFTARLNVDLGCDGTKRAQVVLLADAANKTAAPGGFTRYTATASTAAWVALSELTDASSNVLLSGLEDINRVPRALTALTAAYPSACIVNVNDSSFLEMPKGVAVSAALLTLGDSQDPFADGAWEINAVSWGDVSFVK